MRWSGVLLVGSVREGHCVAEGEGCEGGCCIERGSTVEGDFVEEGSGGCGGGGPVYQMPCDILDILRMYQMCYIRYILVFVA